MSRLRHRPRGGAIAEVEKKLENEFFWLDLPFPERLYDSFPSPEERSAFAELYPEIFYKSFGCEDRRHASMHPTAARCCVFCRADFLPFLEAHPATTPFDPPDLRGLPYFDKLLTMAQARAAWWKSNGWPVTEEEQAWLSTAGHILPT